MAKINPSDNQQTNVASTSDTTQYKELTAGKKILSPVGAVYRKTMSGKRFCEITFVCMYDLDKKGEEGATHNEKYYLQESTNWRWAQLANALQYTEIFDNEVGTDVMKMLVNDGARIQVELQEREYNGKTSLQFGQLGQVKKNGKIMPFTDNELHLLKKAMKSFEEQQNWRKSNGWEIELIQPPSDGNNDQGFEDFQPDEDLPF